MCAADLAADINGGATSDQKHGVRHRVTISPLSGCQSVLMIEDCQMGLRQPHCTRHGFTC